MTELKLTISNTVSNALELSNFTVSQKKIRSNNFKKKVHFAFDENTTLDQLAQDAEDE